MSRDAASYGAHAVCRQELVTGLVEQMRTFRAGLGEGVGLKLDLNYNFKVEGFKQVVQALSPAALGGSRIRLRPQWPGELQRRPRTQVSSIHFSRKVIA